jgi:diguanylate cyclase (GGDEF)-like protein
MTSIRREEVDPDPTEGMSSSDRRADAGAGNYTTSRSAITREVIGIVLLVVVMVAVVWGSISLHLAEQRQEVAARAALDSGNLARSAAISIDQTVASVDDALRFLRAVYDTDPQRFDIGAWSSRVNKAHPIALEFVVMNRDGLLVASSLGPVNTPKDFSLQRFFRVQREGPYDQLFISQPTLGRTSNRWSILFTRKLVSPDGWFTGVMAASAEASWLMSLHQALDIGRGSLMLVGADGVVRALASGGAPGFGARIGESIAHSTLLTNITGAEQGSFLWTGPPSDVQQIVSFQRLSDYPMTVVVGLDSRDVFAAYALYARHYVVFGVCLTALIILTGSLLLRNTQRLLVSRQVLRDTVNAIGQGIIMIDRRGRIPVINRRARDLLRLPPHGAGRELGVENITGWPLPVGDRKVSRLLESARPPSYTHNPCEHVQTDGTVLEIYTHSLNDGSVVCTYTDVTERKKAAAAIAHLAYHDSMTGLANRRLFMEKLAEAIGCTRRTGQGYAVLSVDLDGFKQVNDEHGHILGDSVLRQVADRMSSLVGDLDVIARFGGDEFCILQVASEQPSAAETLARRVTTLLCQPYKVAGREILLSASVGFAIGRSNGSSVDELLTRADTALYYAKAAGRNAYLLYDPAMEIKTAERRQLEDELGAALKYGALLVLYEPIFETGDSKPVAFEALLRWNHPTRGLLSPAFFIPIAENCGLITDLTQWVTETACREALRWPSSLSVAVNLSPKIFQRMDVGKYIMSTLTETGLAADRLIVEVTEGVLIDNRDRAFSVLASLRQRGVRVSLDDFGTGYSSLSYLREMPLDSLKIDKSFINALFEDNGSQAIVQTVLTLAKNLNLTVIAEGVESQRQLQWLRGVGCPQVQGYLLGRPAAPDRIGDFLMQAPQRPESARNNG